MVLSPFVCMRFRISAFIHICTADCSRIKGGCVFRKSSFCTLQIIGQTNTGNTQTASGN